MRFSERIGKKKVKCELQIESMDSGLRNSLWNVVYFFTFRQFDELSSEWERFFNTLWVNFYKKPIDEIKYYYKSDFEEHIKNWFYSSDYLDIYDFIDSIVKIGDPFDVDKFKEACNQILRKELSAYRFIGNDLSPITNKVEIDAIEKAINESCKKILKGVQLHLESSLRKLSDRKNPDYRNSIKESISAVESLCIIISKNSNASLGQALKLIKDKVCLHPALEKGFNSIYGYTSNADGIRHAMIEESECDFDDAKYMLVSCSAFVNYLIMKANKAGLIT